MVFVRILGEVHTLEKAEELGEPRNHQSLILVEKAGTEFGLGDSDATLSVELLGDPFVEELCAAAEGGWSGAGGGIGFDESLARGAPSNSGLKK